MKVIEKIRVDKPITIDLKGIIDLDDDQFYELCIQNKELRFERSNMGDLVIQLPVGSEGGVRELSLASAVFNWNKKSKLGKAFSSSTGFTLPNGAMRSPDASFITHERWKDLSKEDRKKFAHICPDFIAELRSESDSIDTLKDKMTEWMDNGCRLAWLIDPIEEKAYIYRPDKDAETIDSFDAVLSGEDVLPDFELPLSELNEDD
ncbi:MAG: hypothetical protein IEMM0008_0383 [bacterium]|nr:MAG: hypothetical protein IEMM0008_0383 [bacterium]